MEAEIKENLKYTKDHEWVEVVGDIVTIGITDYAQSSIGDLVYVELPEVGGSFDQGADLVIVESCKAASDVYAPISGEVVEVNNAVVESPGTVNTAPYADGWLVKVKAADVSQIDTLMNAAEYKEHAAE